MWGSNRSPGAPPPMHQQQQQQQQHHHHQQQQQVAPPSAGVHDLFSNMYGQDQAPSQYHYTPAPAAPQPSMNSYPSSNPMNSYPSSNPMNSHPSSNPPSYQAASSPQYQAPSNGYEEVCQPVYAQKNKVYSAQSYGAEDNTAPGQPPIEHQEPEPAIAYSRQGSQIYSPLQSAELYDPRSQSNSAVSPDYGQTSPGQQAVSPSSYFGQSGSPSFSPGQSNAYSPGQSNAYSPGQSNSAYSPVAYKPQTSHPYTSNSDPYSSSPNAGADKSDAYVHGSYAVHAPDHASRDNAFVARGMSVEEPFMPPPPPPEIAPMEPAPDTPGLAPPPPPTFGMPPSAEPYSPSSPAPPAPPPPPPLPSSSPNKSWKDNQDNQNQASPSQPTRLAQQLSNMSVGDGSYPFANETPASSAPGGPGYGAPSYVGGSKQSPTSPNRPPHHSPEKSPGHVMPDAVLNMAAKGPPEKKPWAYAPDMDSIKNQRDKVRRKQPGGNLPHYQHMLNMPDFNDPPKLITPPAGPTTPGQQHPEDQVNEDGVYVHSQYNSPLQMYSNDNVDEAFSGQTEGKVSGTRAAGTPGTPNKDIVMSPTYRLIHGLDAGKPKQKVTLPPEARHNVRQPSKDDELKFSGLVSQSDIPSKSFHRLQQQIHDDPGVPQQPSDNTLGVQDVGNYDETSIRYRGKNIPSKSFRMLQDMTGGPMENLPESQTPAPASADQAPAVAPDRAPAVAPARSPAVAPAPARAPAVAPAVAPVPSSSGSNVAVQVVSNPEQQGRGGTGGRRRRPQPQQIVQEAAGGGDRPPPADFDESAYLSGKVKIVSGSVNNPNEVDYESYKHKEKERAPWEKTDEEKAAAFDEQAFLKGQIPVLNDEPKYRPDRGETPKEQAPWEGRRAAEDEEDDQLRAHYDEHAFLAGKIPLVRGDSTDGSALAPVTYTRPKPKKKKEVEQGHPMMEDFDEQAFLQGKIDILGAETNPALPPRGPRQKPARERAPWERVPAQGEDHQEGVIEEQRRPIPILRNSVDRDTTPEHGGRKYRQRAPWERGTDDYIDSACSSDAEFDESAFFKGRVPASVRRASQDSEAGQNGNRSGVIPSKKFTMLRRSISRDRSPSRESDSGYNSLHPGEENQDPDKVIKKMTYKGGSIPSKAFMRLQRMTSKGAPPTPEEIAAERLRRANSKDNLDVDEAIEKMHIQGNEPEQYMEKLKKTMEEQDVKIEPEPEVTDF